MKTSKFLSVRKMTVTAVMSAVAFVLMMLEFATPLTPEFLKFDFSDLPAVITSFAFGPAWGVLVELIKNLLHMPFSHTGCVGELANFIVGAAMVFPAGLIYKIAKNRKGALIGSLVGTLTAVLVSFPINYFITYPFYTGFMELEVIVGMYSAIIPAANTLPRALIIVNMPFTFIKFLLCSLITFFVYKRLSPILKGKNKDASVKRETPKS